MKNTTMRNHFQTAILAIILFLTTNHTQIYAKPSTPSQHTDVCFTDALTCYREQLASQPLQYTLLYKEKRPQMDIYSYQLTSQSWSPGNIVLPSTWLHDIDIFIPENAYSQRALVIVNNGTNHTAEDKDPMSPTDFTTEMLETIARATRTIVISISNVPNQHLVYHDDGKLRREDDSVACSWTLFMSAPEEQLITPLHLPMTIAVSQVMTLAQQELKQWNIKSFIVSGASKRGWVAWLSAIADPRIEAIAPFVINLLNINVSLKHMYQSYGGNWPIAFYPYYQENIDKKIDTVEFSNLMQIVDPLQYLGSKYEPRLTISKYIINASGDDFFVPDNTTCYYDKLPGDKTLRVAPNTDHYKILTIAEESLITFVNRIQNSIPMPNINVRLHPQKNSQVLTAHFFESPQKITLWTANNPISRDFRYACGIRYTSSPLELTSKGDVEVLLKTPTTGWQATFIEATFNDGLVVTTPVYILPKDRYPTEAPPSDDALCKTLPGRK